MPGAQLLPAAVRVVVRTRAVGVGRAAALGGQRARRPLPARAPLELRALPAARRALLPPARPRRPARLCYEGNFTAPLLRTRLPVFIFHLPPTHQT